MGGGMGGNVNRQSVDWYAGLAAEQHAQVQAQPGLESMPEQEEQEREEEHEGNGHAVPEIQVQGVGESEEAGGETDAMEDVDKGVMLRVRSLYAYEGQRTEDLCTSPFSLIHRPSVEGLMLIGAGGCSVRRELDIDGAPVKVGRRLVVWDVGEGWEVGILPEDVCAER